MAINCRWLTHAFLWLESRSNTNAARGKTTSTITNSFHVDSNVKISDDRVLTCWIAKGWRKTVWVKFSASPVVSTNQFLLEDVSQVLKSNKMHRINVRWNKQKTTPKKTVGENDAYVQGMGWATVEVKYRRVKRGINAILQNGYKHVQWKSTRILAR